jgi:NADPH2:quinone reductase
MRAAWYDRAGAAADVLEVADLPDPTPGAGEVRVALTRSGVNPGDTKKRADWTNAGMAFARIIPHSDGAGVIDAVGGGVPPGRVGERVWVYGAQSYRPFGTAAQFTTVPDAQAVGLPDAVGDELGACLGIPGITAHRAVFADGDVAGTTVLVQGVLGAVSSIAAQLAAWRGATVIGTVRRAGEVERVDRSVVPHLVALDGPDPAEAIRAHAPNGVDRIIEVAFSDNVELDASVAALGATIATFATRGERPELPFWPMLFNNLTVRLLGSDDFPVAAKTEAATDLTAAAAAGALSIVVAETHPLGVIAVAHDRVDAGAGGRVLLAID